MQRQAIAAYCGREGHTLVAEYLDEAITGGTLLSARSAAARMLDECRPPRIDGVIALRLDRLSRNLADLLGFVRRAQKSKLRVLFVTETFDDSPAGRLTFSLLGAIAQFEREQTGQRIREHNRWLASQGRWPSGYAPLGLHYDPLTKRLDVEESRAADVPAVFQAFLDASGNWRETIRRLNALGIRAARGGSWNIRGLQIIIRNPLYRGVLRYAGSEWPIEVPEVVPRDLMDAAQVLAMNVHGAKARTDRAYTYTSILRCGLCGMRLIARTGKRVCGRELEKPWGRYMCRGVTQHQICEARGIGETRLDYYLVPILHRLLLSHARGISEAELAPMPKPVSRNRDQSRERIKELYIDGLLDKEEMTRRLERLNIEAESTQRKPIVALPQEIRATIEHFPEAWAGMPPTDRRSLLLLIAPRIAVTWVDNALCFAVDSPLSPEPIIEEFATQRSRHKH